MTTIDAASALHVTRQAVVYQLRRLGVKKQGRDYVITRRVFEKLRRTMRVRA